MSRTITLGPSAHVDTFARDNLPPFEQWPDILLDRPEFQYPERLNVGVELTDRMVEKGFGDQYRADRQRAPAHLQRACRLVEPTGPCA